MQYPQPLPKRGTIGFVAPSFGAAFPPYSDGLDAAQAAFGRLGYNCFEYGCARKAEGIGISAAPDACGEELTRAYADGSSDVLLSCGGGELMCETISHVDFDALKTAAPKWFCGYSDNTNFGFLLPTLLDTALLYAPCAPTFGMQPWDKSLHDCFSILIGEDPAGKNPQAPTVTSYPLWEIDSLKDAEHPYVPYNLCEPSCMQGFVFDTASKAYVETHEVALEGRILGGCLDCAVGLVGTRFDKVRDFGKRYQDDGVIWVLEACDLGPFGVRRALWQMAQAGWFEHAKGFMFGRPYRFDADDFGLDQLHAVLGALESLGLEVPVIVNVDMGHLPPMMPIIMGSYASVRLDREQLTCTMNMV